MTLVSCGSETADVTFTVQAPPTDQALIARVEATLQEASEVVLIGTVTGRDETVLVASWSEDGEECVGVFEPGGSITGCGGIGPAGDQWIVLQGGGGRNSTVMLMSTPPEATEIRMTTGDGVTYSAPTLGEFGYISFDAFDGSRVVSIWADDEMIHEQ